MAGRTRAAQRGRFIIAAAIALLLLGLYVWAWARSIRVYQDNGSVIALLLLVLATIVAIGVFAWWMRPKRGAPHEEKGERKTKEYDLPHPRLLGHEMQWLIATDPKLPEYVRMEAWDAYGKHISRAGAAIRKAAKNRDFTENERSFFRAPS